jgi:hypothetical protein
MLQKSPWLKLAEAIDRVFDVLVVMAVIALFWFAIGAISVYLNLW